MNWFQQNRWLGTFLIVFAVCTLGALFFLFHAKGGWDEALARFNEASGERNRLENLDPYPNEQNFRKVKGYLDEYGTNLEKLKQDLKTRALPVTPTAPNEFQSRLRQSILNVSEKARNNKVKLPDNFALGFDEYTAALPNTTAAPLLAQELAQVELLMNIMLDAHVDEVTGLTRVPLPEERGAAPAPSPSPGARKPAGPAAAATGPKALERNVVDISFNAAPSAARKVLNQIGTSSQQLFIARTIYAHSLQDKGPPREQAPTAQSAAAAAAAAANPNAGLKFIVGNEHIEAAARIEMLRFTL